jgi:hypothetical protein
MSRFADWLVLVLAALALSACGFTGNLRADPGFASFRTPSTLGSADRQFGLSLGPVPLRLATMISRPIFKDEDPWIPATLKSVRAVRVYSYEIDGDDDRVREHIEVTRGELVADGWVPIVAVREDGGLVAALVMPRDPDIRGLVVMYEEDDDLVLVNVIGNIAPETLGTLMAGLDIELPVIEISGI